MPVIIAADLKRFAPHAAPRVVAAFEAHGDAAFARWGIATAARLQMFMAQVRVESAGLAVLFENMSYTAARIHAVWPSRFPSVASAEPYARNPQRLAGKVYGDRMGNRPGTDDGWLCRGQGLLDNTGRAGFAQLAAHMGIGFDVARAEVTSDDGMVGCAAATFHMLGCLPAADRDDLVGCTKRINGGLIGLANRRAALEAARKIWPAPHLPQAAHPHIAPLDPPPREPKPALRTHDPVPLIGWPAWLAEGLARLAA